MKNNFLDVSNLSTTDICRICHMGGFPVLTVENSLWEWPKQNAPRNTSQTSTLSSYAYLGPLISVCKFVLYKKKSLMIITPFMDDYKKECFYI